MASLLTGFSSVNPTNSYNSYANWRTKRTVLNVNSEQRLNIPNKYRTQSRPFRPEVIRRRQIAVTHLPSARLKTTHECGTTYHLSAPQHSPTLHDPRRSIR